jgi:chaperonin GroES
MKLQPLKDWVVAKPIKAQEKTESGFYIPDTAKEKPNEAEVVAVGNDVEGINIGDLILYSSKYESSKEEAKTMDGQEIIYLKDKDIVAIVKG